MLIATAKWLLLTIAMPHLQVNDAFDELEEGNEEALKVVFERQVSQLADLINLINGKLTNLERKKLITLCTIDVHARDVVQRLIEERVEDGMCFQWQSQLRYSQNEKTRSCQVGRVPAGDILAAAHLARRAACLSAPS